ncbi:MqnA/MqnD/SBP family protein [Sulfurihydrogenibium subterraneum]|uniref:MqnA/MqnD/SBP family protein n=1 Tax=Sulfurihydrogenibium subterraneum TaxID=171121 RepID=UPI00048CF4A5|nr:MqnA/MqnD/SBP family protein [Sulfurihydrogenibium subterraneum]
MKVGWIDYLNTLPFGIEKFKGITIVKDYPANLNKFLKEKKIDAGIVSTAEYLENFFQYLIIPDLSISSYKEVNSVIIGSDIPLQDIEVIYLTKESKTSVYLTKVIFEIFLGKKPVYKYFDTYKKRESVLLIGNKAIEYQKDYKYVYDLSKLWFDKTGLPFTFALWCVNKDFFLQNKEKVLEFAKRLKQNVKEFFEKIDSLDLEVNKKEYLKNLKYGLDSKNIEAIKLFAKYLLDLKIIKTYPDLRFIDGKVITADGTQTFYNFEYNEAYHSTKAGAYTESLYKFILPCKIDRLAKEKHQINILDVGFGLGYNVAVAINVAKNNNPDVKISIISIEKDKNFLDRINQMEIPENLKDEYDFIKSLKPAEIKLNENLYPSYIVSSDTVSLTVVIGEGRKILLDLSKSGYKFDAVFYDPFSPKVNTEMWTLDLFKVVKTLMTDKAILATYSASLPVRKGLIEAGFKIGLVEPVGRRSYSTVATINGDIPVLPEKEKQRLETSPLAKPYTDPCLCKTKEEIFKEYQKTAF